MTSFWRLLWSIPFFNHFIMLKNYFHFSPQIINIFNLFITYGDTFLASPRNYDLLYYEVIRMRSVFENVYSFGMWILFVFSNYSIHSTFMDAYLIFIALKYSTVDGDFRDPAAKIISGLINIRWVYSVVNLQHTNYGYTLFNLKVPRGLFHLLRSVTSSNTESIFWVSFMN